MCDTIVETLESIQSPNILLVDGDNVPGMAETLDRFMIMYGSPKNLTIIVFLARDANFKKLFELAAKNPWIHIFRAITKAKNACDTAITVTACWLIQRSKYQPAVSIFTKDHFALETVAWIHLLYETTAVWINTIDFRFYLAQLTGVLPDALDASQDTLPSQGYVCGICGATDHWMSACPTRSSVVPKRGYTCKICGCPGGLAESHWFYQCRARKQ
jgi:hypothetical protein